MDKVKELHSRYAYLLQPIRDLTRNWDVDVASQLEDYITEVGNEVDTRTPSYFTATVELGSVAS